jgi:hypothetical protein
VGLSFRVRNGTGRFPHAMTAVTLAPRPSVPGGMVVGKTLVLQQLWFHRSGLGPGVVVLWSCVLCSWTTGLLFGNHIVDASSLVSLYPPPRCERLLNPFTEEGVWCKLSAY